MEETVDIEIRYSQGAQDPVITQDELVLLESMLPDLIHAMMALEGEEIEK